MRRSEKFETDRHVQHFITNASTTWAQVGTLNRGQPKKALYFRTFVITASLLLLLVLAIVLTIISFDMTYQRRAAIEGLPADFPI